MDVRIERETLCYERQAASVSEQVSIEGEATLPGSMRDAVTVLSVQARAHLTEARAQENSILVRGRVGFQVLYTQGDLTRIRVIETACDFDNRLSAQGVHSGMRAEASVCVRESNGVPGSGRLSLSAQLDIHAGAYEQEQVEAVAAAKEDEALCAKTQTLLMRTSEALGEESALVREEFDLAEHLGVGDVLTASGAAQVTQITGGNGRVGVGGVVEMRVLHRSAKPGQPLVTTIHELPFQVSIPAQIEQGTTPQARAEVIDVMADSAKGERGRTMRAEAEIRVRLYVQRETKRTLLEDLYTTQGPALAPQTQELALYTARECGCERESVRIRAVLAADAPPMETALAAFAHPLSCRLESAGRRTKAEGVMEVTLLYLPVDSDIPYAVRTREPFAMTFPIETPQEAEFSLETIECALGPSTSDRAELRCLMALEARSHAVNRVRIVTGIEEAQGAPLTHGFMLVWPAPGETRWETARRLRVRQEHLKSAGTGALMALRK